MGECVCVCVSVRKGATRSNGHGKVDTRCRLTNKQTNKHTHKKKKTNNNNALYPRGQTPVLDEKTYALQTAARPHVPAGMLMSAAACVASRYSHESHLMSRLARE